VYIIDVLVATTKSLFVWNGPYPQHHTSYKTPPAPRRLDAPGSCATVKP